MKKLFILFLICMFSALTPVFAQDDVTRVHAYHILVANKRQAQAIINRIDSGETFASLAKKYSLCPSGQFGGNLGYFERGKMVPEFENAAFKLDIGEISKPVKTDFGWHVIKVVDKE